MITKLLSLGEEVGEVVMYVNEGKNVSNLRSVVCRNVIDPETSLGKKDYQLILSLGEEVGEVMM